MKTIKLIREKFERAGVEEINEDFCADRSYGGFGGEAICLDGLVKLFDVPKDTQTIWVTIRKTFAKGFFRAKMVDINRGGGGGIGVNLWGKDHEIYREAEMVLNAAGFDTYEKFNQFYFSIEYKS